MSSSPPLRALWGALACGALPLAAQAAEGSCIEPWQSAPQLLAAAAPAAAGNAGDTGPAGDITTRSDRLDTGADGVTELSGHVDVHMGDREIEADHLTYDRAANRLSAAGSVRYRDPVVLLQGQSGHYDEQGAQFSQGRFELRQQPGHGSADEIVLRPDKTLTLRHVTYSSCPPPRADWEVRARELRLDTVGGRGIGRDASVEFEGVPILYLPWISFPLSSARQSGVLFPNFGSSSLSGAFLGVPWYWNIAPNQDATFTPTVYSTRGVDLGGEYRLLTAATEGRVDADWLPHDRQTHSDRSFVRLIDRYQLGGNTRIDTNVENVSDVAYFEDFTQGTESTSTPFLPRRVGLSHRDDVWNLRAEMVDFQTLDDTLPLQQRPYIQLPRLAAAGQWSPSGWPALQTSLESELVNFTRAGCDPCTTAAPCNVPSPCNVPGTAALNLANVSGWRFDLMPRLGLDLSGPGYFLRPGAAWEFTQYALRDLPAGPGSPQRSLPILSVDSGLEFERLSLPDGARSLTLEPRAMYVYIPYRNQDALPVFNSSLPDPNLIELFRPNRFVGVDRVGDENGLTLGLTSQLFDSGTGMRYLSATVGQAIYFNPARVRLPDQSLPGAPLQSIGTSNLIAELILSAWHDWSLQLDIASNPGVSAIAQDELTLQYHASNQQVANVSYLYRAGQLAQIDGSVAWPVARHWDVYARAVYSLFDNPSAVPVPIHPEWIEDFAGFQYRGACWNLRVVWQRSVSTRTGAQSSGVSFQLELTGLSSVGSQVTTFLEQSIRGYSGSPGRQPLF
jgi:LPS-assembly protein